MGSTSSVDTAKKIVTHLYPKYRGFPDSTRKTFQTAEKGTIDERVPEKIRSAFRGATWYAPFRQLRNVLTHVGPGGCHLDPQTGKVGYYHNAIRNGNQVMYIPDIFKELNRYTRDVNQFLGQVFGSLNESLKDKEVSQLCGVFGGRLYSRHVRPSEAFDFNSGRCDSYKWFDLPGNPRCPFIDKCAAYQRK
jgi:hypothetical protein